ncbi:MAG: hypothetical protein M3220_08495 [Chloroflexota bacterium]|nr:hypothetical protein [Chloroflexota bacterium]
MLSSLELSKDCVYILRCWFEPSVRGGEWRFRLEEPSTGEHYGFASLEGFLAFLEREFSDEEESTPPTVGAGQLGQILGK